MMDTVAWRPQQLVQVKGIAVIADAIRWLEVNPNVHTVQEEDACRVILNEVPIHPQSRLIVFQLEVQLHFQVRFEQGHPCRKRKRFHKLLLKCGGKVPHHQNSCPPIGQVLKLVVVACYKVRIRRLENSSMSPAGVNCNLDPIGISKIGPGCFRLIA